MTQDQKQRPEDGYEGEGYDGEEYEADEPSLDPEGAEPDEAQADERVAALAAEVASLRDQLLRAVAETENVRKRMQRERDDAGRYGASAFARDMLSVADNLRRALEAVPAEAAEKDETLKALVTGIEMTERELQTAFERHGLKRVDPQGQPFDHNLHQAMFEVPGTGQPEGTVVQVMQPGYVMHDRLLRPAMVGVAKGQPTQPGEKVDTQA